MKTRLFFLIQLVFIFTCSVKSQKIDQDSIHFNEFISFFPERDYPFTISPDYDKTTQFKGSLKEIPSNLYKLYFCNQGMQCKSDYCSASKFFGFRAFGAFPSSKKFKLILMAYDLDAGCEQKWYLLTYNKNGQLIDKLFFYAEGFLELPKENNPVESTYSIEGTILQDTIITERQEETYNRKTKEKIVNKTKNTYIINSQGHFMKTKAK